MNTNPLVTGRLPLEPYLLMYGAENRIALILDIGLVVLLVLLIALS